MVTTIATPTTKLPVPAWRQTLDDTDGHRQLTTLEGWREFTAAATVPPATCTSAPPA